MITESPIIVNKPSTSVCGGLRSRNTTALGRLLGWILAWRPSIALRLGKLMMRVWGGFGRA
jgi:hypothetical protein